MKNTKIKITFDEYDRIVDAGKNVPIKEYWPDENDISMVRENPLKYIEFLICFQEYCKPQTDEEKRRMRLVKDYLNSTLEFEDE